MFFFALRHILIEKYLKGDKKRGGKMGKIKWISFLILFYMCLNFNLSATSAVHSNKAYVIIIIDDFGNNMAGTEEILSLPIPITGAVIPGMPYAKEDAKRLYDAGKEIIYHVPLEPIKGKREWLGPKGIVTGMSEEEIRKRLDEASLEIPYAKGMNNHMGSRAMQSETIVKSLMHYAKDHNLYFVDSKTTDTALSQKWSNEAGVAFFERNVFLDNVPEVGKVKERLRETMKVAKEKGVAVAIGHVGPKVGPPTSRALKEMIPIMQEAGIEFITVSEYLKVIK